MNLIAGIAFAVISSITVNNPTPQWGDTITFTAVYPQEARQGGRNPQYPDHPQIDGWCYHDGVLVQIFHTAALKERRSRNGSWTAVSGPVTLGRPSNDLVWPSTDDATCHVALGNWTQIDGVPTFTLYATSSFYVIPA